MNRLEMAAEIAKRVPVLANRDKDKWLEASRLREGFVKDYPRERIANLTLDEYVIGKGGQNPSFCYRLERKMDVLGKIVGSPAIKFGVYFGRKDSADRNAPKKYQFAKMWGGNVEDAFTVLKEAIVELIQSASNRDMTAIANNRLSPMLKGKILFVYNPDQFAPIYSRDHLEYFTAKLDLNNPVSCEADMQRALMEYRATWPDLLAQSPALYMQFLYHVLGWPPKRGAKAEEGDHEPLLDEAATGALFLDEMPASAFEARTGAAATRKVDYELQSRQLKRIGDRGEALVVALEENRLIQAGKSDYARDIKHVSQENDGAGYDIRSFDEDGTTRYIEVKATTGNNLDRGFFISDNEVEKAAALPNYYIYFVFSAMTKKPRIFRMKQPVFDGDGFVLRPVAYLVTLSDKFAR